MPDLDDMIAQLRELNQPVPQPRRLPTAREVAETEGRAGVVLHPDMRRYLLEASDVVFDVLEPVTIGGGHTNFNDVLHSARQLGVPVDLIPICEDNSDFYCVTPSGEVVFWSHNGTNDEKWADLATWISKVWIQGN